MIESFVFLAASKYLRAERLSAAVNELANRNASTIFPWPKSTSMIIYEMSMKKKRLQFQRMDSSFNILQTVSAFNL